MASPLSRWNARIAPPSKLEPDSHRIYHETEEAAPPTAVLVFHGIGEEVRFETLSRAASLILQEATERNAKDISVVIRSVPTNIDATDLIVRSELSWTEQNGRQRQVHVYEVYWAPLTVGKISYSETITFLISAGWNGLRGVFRSGKRGYFHRWLFGDFRLLALKAGTLNLLIVLLIIIGITVGAIAMAIAAAADALKEVVSAGPAGAVPNFISFVYHQLVDPWNFMMKRMGDHLLVPPDPSWQHWPISAAVIALWILCVVFAYQLRDILTQYAGSLVAYLSPYKDSKFEELRGQIQQVGIQAGTAILDGHIVSKWMPKYERIVYVAHSLGSVLAYDTLNAMINMQGALQPQGAPNPAVLRTTALITLGCPLDKTAYLFRVQLKVGENPFDEYGELRETMVGAVQPLISDPANRYRAHRIPHGPRWINIWSPMDIISGKLAYYDDPADVEKDQAAQKKTPPGAKDLSLIENLTDPGAWIPIAAHNQYWTTALMRKTVYDQLF